jgi:hypothetical protein
MEKSGIDIQRFFYAVSQKVAQCDTRDIATLTAIRTEFAGQRRSAIHASFQLLVDFVHNIYSSSSD